jgi:hypothetical protein
VGDQNDPVNCRRCRIPLPVLGAQNARFLGNQRVALALEKNIWASFQGQAPDPSWAGPLSSAQFFELIGQLIQLLTSREADGGSILADRLNSLGFPGHYSTDAEQPSIAPGMLGGWNVDNSCGCWQWCCSGQVVRSSFQAAHLSSRCNRQCSRSKFCCGPCRRKLKRSFGNRYPAGPRASRRGCLRQLLGNLGKPIPLLQVNAAVESIDSATSNRGPHFRAR